MIDEELEEYDLHLVESEEPDRRKIDFRIFDKYDTFCAEVSGDSPDDVEVDCEHPTVEFDDDETVGECPLCGACATWHWHVSADDGYTIKEHVVDTWDHQNVPGGIIGRYMKELAKDGKSV